MYKHFFKRVIDFSIALIALLVIWPILLIVAIWLHFANKGAGAFFLQDRPGLHGQIFKVIKFKTMTDERDAEGNLLPDAERLTKVGRFVRSTSIDELPQLINVLKGDMALIGPVIAGVIVAVISGIAAIKVMIKIVSGKKLIGFTAYVWLVAAVVLGYALISG